MQVPEGERRTGRDRRAVRRSLALAALLVGLVAMSAGSALAAGKPDKQKGGPWVQLPLDALGFPGISQQFLDIGASMLTVDFVDEEHLLLTYSDRSLVPRIADDPDAGQDDRVVVAKIVELPGGKVVAKTSWHMHDHARYLWKLGGGSFLVRIGDQLYTMSPGARLGGGEDVFQRTVFPAQALRPAAVVVSPDGALVTVETVVKTANSTGQTIVVLGDNDTPVAEQMGTKTLIDFYRLSRRGGVVDVQPAGTIAAPTPLLLPVDADGLLWAQPADAGTWSLTFDAFGGKTVQLGKVQSSCQPRLQMLDRSEFLAVSCRGGEDRIRIASYGLDGKETWEEPVGEFGPPAFAFAPAAARFAVSHTEAAEVPVTAGTTGAPARQEVRVYQNASGDLLLKVETSPILKSAENFDLSASGTELVAVRGGMLALYKLPALSGRDKEDIAEVEKFAPPAVTEGAVKLPRLTGTSAPLPTARAAVPMGQPGRQDVARQPLPQQPVARKPPTLLEPGEKPEFGSANEQPPPP
jgi:hypothetical protein